MKEKEKINQDELNSSKYDDLELMKSMYEESEKLNSSYNSFRINDENKKVEAKPESSVKNDKKIKLEKQDKVEDNQDETISVSSVKSDRNLQLTKQNNTEDRKQIKIALLINAIFLLIMIPLSFFTVFSLYYDSTIPSYSMNKISSIKFMNIFRALSLNICSTESLWFIGIFIILIVVLIINSLVYFFNYNKYYNNKKLYKIFYIINIVTIIMLCVCYFLVYILLDGNLTAYYSQNSFKQLDFNDVYFGYFNMLITLYPVLFGFMEYFFLYYIHSRSGFAKHKINKENSNKKPKKKKIKIKKKIKMKITKKVQ